MIRESISYCAPFRPSDQRSRCKAERCEADGQETHAFEQDRMEAIRLQEQFDQEDDRERQAISKYVKGLEKVIQLQEEEERLQAQQQARY